jgi:hypothetical protein
MRHLELPPYVRLFMTRTAHNEMATVCHALRLWMASVYAAIRSEVREKLAVSW